MSTVAETPRTQANASKYLTFVLGHESYGVSVLKVREIIRMLNITPVPKMPDYLKGVINLRGKVIPVIDLRMRFKLAVIETTERTCIIVMQIEHDSGVVSQVGLIVDAVEEPPAGEELDNDVSAVNTAAECRFFRNNIAAHAPARSKDQGVAADIAVNAAIKMDIAATADIASDCDFGPNVRQRARSALCGWRSGCARRFIL